MNTSEHILVKQPESNPMIDRAAIMEKVVEWSIDNEQARFVGEQVEAALARGNVRAARELKEQLGELIDNKILELELEAANLPTLSAKNLKLPSHSTQSRRCTTRRPSAQESLVH